MKKVLLVDDDAIILRGLMHSIDWQANGFTLVGSAANGVEAMALVQQHEPELVVSDIKMPVMDGIELCRCIMRDYPSTKVILLSGHEDFAYAQEAIDLKVFAYLTKPVHQTVLCAALAKAKSELVHQQITSEQMKESMPLLRQQFLQGLLFGSSSDEQLEAKLTFFGIPIWEKHVVAVLHIPSPLPRTAPQDGDLPERIQMNIALAAERFFAVDESDYTVNTADDYFVYIHYSNREYDYGIIDDVSERLTRFISSVKAEYSVDVTAGISDVHYGPRLDKAWREAKQCLKYTHLAFENGIVFTSDIHLDGKLAREDYGTQAAVEQIVQSAANVDYAACLDAMEGLKMDMRLTYQSPREMRIAALQIAIMLHSQSKAGPNANDTVGALCSNLLSVNNIDDIFVLLGDYISGLCNAVKENRDDCAKQVVQHATQFINEHYADAELGLKVVARNVGISHSYLCVLFKKVLGIKFYDYLLQVRMEHAVDILKQGDVKMYEISDKTGFSNPQYFGTCFKKYFGKTISEYKKLLE